MRSLYYFPFIIALLVAGQLNAALPLNPLEWFADSDQEPESITSATTAEQSAAQSLLEEGRRKFENGRIGSANSTFKKIVKKYPTSPAAAEALYLRGRVFMTKGRWVKAFNFHQQVIDDHPTFSARAKVLSAQFECATALMEGARGRIFGVIPGFKQYNEAIDQFEQIVQNAPYGDYAPLALMNISFTAEKTDNGDIAIDALDRLINYYPQSMLAPDAYYNLALTYANLVKGEEYDQGSTRQAISYYEDFLVLFPESSSVGEVQANMRKMENLLAGSRLTLGDFYYYHRNNNTAALVFYNEAITIAPESDAAVEAQARIKDIEAGVRPATTSNFFKKILFVD